MFYCYILYSPSTDVFYKGQTADIRQRVLRHNAGFEKSTSSGRPWKMLWYTSKSTRSEAIVLESKLKNLSRKKLIQFMLKYDEGIVDGEMDTIVKFEP